MKRKNNAGFSMIEVLMAIVILAGIVVPVCTSLVLSLRMNAKAENVLQARLAVSSAVETLMAEGISEAGESYEDRFSNIDIQIELSEDNLYYNVKVSSDDGLVTVTTCIRAADSPADEEEGAQ